MSDNTIMLDPTSELDPVQRQRLARPETLEGLKVGLLDISKARGDVFLDRIAKLLGEKGIEIKRYAKPTFARPAPTDLSQQIAAEVDVVVEALAD